MGNLALFTVFGWPAGYYFFVDFDRSCYGHYYVQWSSDPNDFDYFICYRDLLKAVLEYSSHA